MVEKVNLKKKSVCVVDYGHEGVELAIRLARDFGKVYFHSPWLMAAPRINFTCIGSGFEEVERVDFFWSQIDKFDLIVFPWVNFWDWQEALRNMGKRVWGAGRGEFLEIYREWAKIKMKEAGLEVNAYDRVRGVYALREFLASHKGVFYIKINGLRGEMESFKHQNMWLSEMKLRQLENQWGPMANGPLAPWFIIEPEVEALCEAGSDGYLVANSQPQHIFESLEVKDCGMAIAYKPYAKASEPIRKVNEAMLKYWPRSGFWGTEIRVVDKDHFYAIDLTARISSPCGEAMMEMIDNLAEVFWFGAEGICLDMRCDWKFGLQAMIYSPIAKDMWTRITFSENKRRWIKIHYPIADGSGAAIPPDVVYSPDPDFIIGAVVGVGNSIKEAAKHLKENSEGFSAFSSDVKLDAIPKAFSELEKGRKAGIVFTEDPIPTSEELSCILLKCAQ